MEFYMFIQKFAFEFNDQKFDVWVDCGEIEFFEPKDSGITIPASFFDHKIVECALNEIERALS
jgi:hypothetical protein